MWISDATISAPLLGYTWEDENQRTIGGYRNNYPSDDVPYLSAGGVDGQTNSGGGYGPGRAVGDRTS